jgi:hypothetical protein
LQQIISPSARKILSPQKSELFFKDALPKIIANILGRTYVEETSSTIERFLLAVVNVAVEIGLPEGSNETGTEFMTLLSRLLCSSHPLYYTHRNSKDENGDENVIRAQKSPLYVKLVELFISLHGFDRILSRIISNPPLYVVRVLLRPIVNVSNLNSF